MEHNQFTEESLNELPQVVNRRNHIASVDLLIDQFMPEFVNHFKMSDEDAAATRVALRRLVNLVYHELTEAAVLGAVNGMRQAATVMNDPKYYQIARRRKEKSDYTIQIKGRSVLDKIIG